MAAPSEVFTVIPDADVDADSPITTALMLALKQNDIHLEEWLGDSFTAAKDHNHDGVNSAGISVGTALFTLSTTGTTAVSTGALSFTPTIVIVVGFLDGTAGADDSVYVGFATGTGTLAHSLAHRLAGTAGFSTDADSIGGRSAAAAASSHLTDLDVTNFAKGAPGIEFTPSASVGTWVFEVLVFGFTA